MRFKYFAATMDRALVARRIETKQLSDQLGFRSSAFIQMWRDGKVLPRLEMLPQIAGALDLDLGVLIADWLVDSAPVLRPHVQDMLAAQGFDGAKYEPG